MLDLYSYICAMLGINIVNTYGIYI